MKYVQQLIGRFKNIHTLRIWLRRIIQYIVYDVEFMLLRVYKKDPHVLGAIRNSHVNNGLMMSAGEAFVVLSVAALQNSLEGDMAEVGVGDGGSSRLIAKAKGPRPLHLFDTFRGLPNPCELDGHHFEHGMFASQHSTVRDLFANDGMVIIHAGLFAETCDNVSERRFSFVHLDGDLYDTTLQALDFFYPRLVRQGIILIHDINCPGVQRAIQEAGKTRKWRCLELNTRQMMIFQEDGIA